MPFWSKTYKVKCPDGAPRIIYRNVDDAIPLELRKRATTIKGMFDVYGKVKGEASTSRENDIRGTLMSLSIRNESLVVNYRQAYLNFMNNPCRNDTEFNRFNQEMAREQNTLVRIEILATTLIELAKQNLADSERFLETLRSIVALQGADQYTAPIAATMEIARTRALASEWITNPDQQSSDQESA